MTKLRFALSVFITAACLSALPAAPAAAQNIGVAYFAGGCFWCTEHDFEKLDGVSSVVSGYMGGSVENPRYEQVASGKSGHFEIVRVNFDPAAISYQKLLSAFWRMHDPSDGDGSFCDRGQQYSTAIFYVDAYQKRLAEGAIDALNAARKFNTGVATLVVPAEEFYPAEGYHQDYAKKNPVRYKFYRHRCGRDQFIKRVWQGDDTLYQSAR